MQLSAEAGRVLLAEARAAMAAQLGQPAPPAVVATAAAWLRQPAATHVTLTLEGKLRGAAGAPPARQALCEDLRSNALAAAFHDPRFKAITSNELDALRIEVSVLSPLETLQWEDEAGALAQLRPGIDGVMVEYGHHRNLFLPQMWTHEVLPQDYLYLYLDLSRLGAYLLSHQQTKRKYLCCQ